jgi:hypothetical protein
MVIMIIESNRCKDCTDNRDESIRYVNGTICELSSTSRDVHWRKCGALAARESRFRNFMSLGFQKPALIRSILRF